MFSDETVEEAGLMSSSQIGKTLLLKAYIGYCIHLKPGAIGLYTSTLTLAKKFSKDRLAPMIRDTPVLRDRISPHKSRSGGNTLLHKNFMGGQLTIAGANSPSSLASQPLRDVLIDELDRMNMDVGGEGDPRQLAVARTKNSLDRKIITMSTPTDEHSSKIYQLWQQSTQERFYLPCPECGHKQPLIFENLKFTDEHGNRVPARYQCRSCEILIPQSKKLWMLKRGEGVAENPGARTRYGHVSELYSTWRTWDEIVEQFLTVKNDVEKLKVFVNTVLGEVWKGTSDAPEWERLYDRREAYERGTLAPEIRFLTAFVDVQGDRLEIEIKGWSRDGQSWSVQHDILPGASAWDMLDGYLMRTWRHPSGVDLSIKALGIDSGDRTQEVYNWSRRHPRDRVFPTKGSSSFHAPAVGIPTAVDVNYQGVKHKKGIRLWPIGVSTLKIELYSRLKMRAQNGVYPPGYLHFPEYSEEFFKQLCSESLTWVYKGGSKFPLWKKTPGQPNEALDLSVGNRAMAIIMGIDRLSAAEWDQIDAGFGVVSVQPKAASRPQRPARPQPRSRIRGRLNLD